MYCLYCPLCCSSRLCVVTASGLVVHSYRRRGSASDVVAASHRTDTSMCRSINIASPFVCTNRRSNAPLPDGINQLTTWSSMPPTPGCHPDGPKCAAQAGDLSGIHRAPAMGCRCKATDSLRCLLSLSDSVSARQFICVIAYFVARTVVELVRTTTARCRAEVAPTAYR